MFLSNAAVMRVSACDSIQVGTKVARFSRELPGSLPPGATTPAPGGRRGGPPRHNRRARCASTSRPSGRCRPCFPVRTTTGSCGARMQSAPRLPYLHLRGHRLPHLPASRLAAGPWPVGMVGVCGQPARLRLLRYFRGRRPPRAVDWVDDRPGRCELEHQRRSSVLPRLRRRNAAYGAHPQVAAAARPQGALDLKGTVVASGDGNMAQPVSAVKPEIESQGAISRSC